MGGAEYSLLDIMNGLQEEPLDFVLLTVPNSVISTMTEKMGISTKTIFINARILSLSKKKIQNDLWEVFAALIDIFKAVYDIYSIIRRERYDLIYTNTLKSHILGGLAGKIAGIKVIWHVRDLPVKSRTAWVIKIASKFLPDRIIAISKAVAMQFNLQKTGVIYNGIDRRIIQAKASQNVSFDMEPLIKLPESTPLIGIIGQISRWKGQDIFLKAALSLTSKFPEAKFLIIGEALYGESDFKRELEEIVEINRITGKVIFTGQMENVYPLLKQLDILAHCSLEPEPFGRVLIEAMALKVPVIGARGGAIEEIIIDGENGLVVPPGDPEKLAEAIEKLLIDRSLREELTRNAFSKNAAEFDFDHMLGKISGEIVQLTGKH
jgi:glycosyltransferase involved in cell wall biosynthesis